MPDNWLLNGGFAGWRQELVLWLARLTVLFLAAAVAAAVVRRHSATLAHRIWITALAGALLLPIFGWIVPAWSWTTGTVEAASGTDDGPVFFPHPPAPSPTRGEGERVQGLPPPSPLVGEGGRGGEGNRTAGSNPAPAKPGEARIADHVQPTTDSKEADTAALWIARFDVACLIWAAVTAILLLRLAVAAGQLARLVRLSPLASAKLRTDIDEIASELGVAVLFEVRLLPPGSMPMASWLGRWTVLLPADIGDWPADVRLTVVAHELGHVARRDAWWDLLTQAVRRVLWPHPLAWLAGSAVPRLRESACDEWVLAAGRVEPNAYARHLLSVVARCAGPAAAFIPAMARPSDLERRLRAVLAFRGARRRTFAGVVAVTACLAVTALLAAAQPAGQRLTAADKPEAPTNAVVRTAEPVPADGPQITVGGVVTGADGRPVDGATVVLRAKTRGQFYSFAVEHNRDVLARTTTNAAGRFAFDQVAVPLRMLETINGLLAGKGGVQLLAWADHWAFASADVAALTNPEPVRLALSPEAPVRGTIRDKAGQPVPGVRISVFGFTRATNDVDFFFNAPGDLNLALSEVAPATTSDAAGRFALAHLPPDRRASVFIDASGLEWKAVIVDTGTDTTLTELGSSEGGRKPLPVVRSPINLTLGAQRALRVKIVDADGRPVSGGAVQAIDDQRHDAGHAPVDDRGEAIINLRNHGKISLSYATDPLKPRLGTSATVDVAQSGPLATAELRCPKAVWLTGRVVDADSGAGVVGAYFYYSRTSANAAEGETASAAAVSGADGRFRIPVARGAGKLQFIHSLYGYLVPNVFNQPPTGPAPPGVPIDVPPTGEPKPVTLSLAHGLKVRGIVRGPDGKPVPGAAVRAQNYDRPFLKAAATTDAGGRFELSGLSPQFAAFVDVHTDTGAGRATVAAAADQPWDKTRMADADIDLRPGITLTGRVTHKGRPRAGVLMRLSVAHPEDGNRYPIFDEVRTDADGRYRVPGLEAGDHYHFEVLDPDGMADPDWHHQSPYMQTVKDADAEVRLPDVRLQTRGQTLRGVVVDPKGKPVPGVTVSARLLNGRTLSRPVTGPPPWIETDAKGRFELRQLPDQPIELMTFRANPKGGPIRYPSYVRPKLNDTSVRIIFDPTLGEEVENLDPPARP